MDHIESSLDSFFANDEYKVLVLKGGWGVGKTYFWGKFFSEKRQEITRSYSYSYVSLFGVSSLKELKSKIFHNTESSSSEDSTFRNKSTHWVSKLSNAIKGTPLEKYKGDTSGIEYSLIENYIVCIDDIERKDKNLLINDVMGLVDELVTQKDCKLVLIFNEDSLKGEEKEQFQSQKEKIVDIEVKYDPSCEKNLSYILGENHLGFKEIARIVSHLSIKNIRVLKKIKLTLDSLTEKISNINEINDEYISELVRNTTLLCYFHYTKHNKITYDEFKKLLHSFNPIVYQHKLNSESEELSEAEKEYDTLASKLKFDGSEFDRHIVFFLENGYIEKEKLEETTLELIRNSKAISVRNKLKSIWRIYQDSFNDNFHEFKDNMMKIITQEAKEIPINSFIQAVSILGEFGENIEPIIDDYLSIHHEYLLSFGSSYNEEESITKIKYLSDQLDAFYKNKIRIKFEDKKKSIDEICSKILENGYNDEDIDFFNQITKEDYIDWIKSSPDNLVMKLRAVVLRLANTSSNDNRNEKFKNICNNIIPAIKELASESEFNKYRAEHLYGITTDSD